MILLMRRRVGEEGPVSGGGGALAPRSSFDALIFDVDGTLADTEDLHRTAFNEAFRAFGLDWSWDRELYAELLRVTGGKERILSYMDRCGTASAQRKWLERVVPDIHATKTQLYNELLERGHVPARTGILRLIREARLAGIRVAIASTTSPQNVDALLRASFGADSIRWFDVIVTGDVVERKKPAPDIYELALSRLGVPADRAIAFEDSEIGVRAACAAGVFTVAVPIHWTAGQDFAAADLLLPSLGDPEAPLPAADEWRIGAKFLGLEQLATVHSARARVE
jgi:HAD superfamily hydrolase (TIGR01509 family)